MIFQLEGGDLAPETKKHTRRHYIIAHCAANPVSEVLFGPNKSSLEVKSTSTHMRMFWWRRVGVHRAERKKRITDFGFRTD